MIEERGEVTWTEEALQRVENAPAFVREGIYKLMVKRARERGRQVITSEFLTEIRNESMLRVAKCIKGFGFEELSMDAFEVAKQKMRRLPRKLEVIEQIKVFLGERPQRNAMIIAKFTHYLQMIPATGLPWTEEALARFQRIPSFVQDMIKPVIEKEAKQRKEKVITPEIVQQVLGTLLSSQEQDRNKKEQHAPEAGRVAGSLEGMTMLWTAQAEERLRRIPLPPVRQMIIQRVEKQARQRGLKAIDLEAYEAFSRTWIE